MTDIRAEYKKLLREFSDAMEHAERLKKQFGSRKKEDGEFERFFLTEDPEKNLETFLFAISRDIQELRKRSDQEMEKYSYEKEYASVRSQRELLRSPGVLLAALLKKAGAKDAEQLSRRLLNVDAEAAMSLYNQKVSQLSFAAADPERFRKSLGLQSSEEPTIASLEPQKPAWVKQRSDLRSVHANMIAAGFVQTIGLKSNGTVVATGGNSKGQCKVSNWKDIVAIAAGRFHTLGLKADGTVVATGNNDKGQCWVSAWKDIVAIAAGDEHSIGLKADGTVIATGDSGFGRCDTSDWKNIVAIAAEGNHSVGLRADGTAIDTRSYNTLAAWKDIIAVAAGNDYTVGLKKDGTVVADGFDYGGKCRVSEWNDIVAIAAGHNHTLGLKADGSVVATGNNDKGQCEVFGWKNIVAISCNFSHSVGLKADGTTVAAGDTGCRECEVSDWKLFEDADFEKQYQQAKMLMSKREYALAEKEFRRVLIFKDSWQLANEVKKLVKKAQQERSEKEYLRAKALLEEGKSSDAIELLENIGSYKDSKKLAAEIKEKDRLDGLEKIYQNAKRLLEKGEYAQAVEMLDSLGSYKDSQQLIDDLKKTPGWLRTSLAALKKGDTVRFGVYPQKVNTKTEKAPVQWMVLGIEQQRLLLLSTKVLDAKPFHSTAKKTTWEQCALREWLNGAFFSDAFSAGEQALVQTASLRTASGDSVIETQDRVFLLSEEEVTKYLLSVKRKLSCTDYAAENGFRVTGSLKELWWWLRSSGINEQKAKGVKLTMTGSTKPLLSEYMISNSHGGVRPAMWIDVS